MPVPELLVARGDEPLQPTGGAVSGTHSEPTVAPRSAERHEVGGVDEEVL
jgi:hypothetical protein